MITRDVPIISTTGIIKILSSIKPRELGRDSNLYDVGYEAAKRDIARVIGNELNLDFSNNPANELIKQIRRAEE